MATNHPSVDTFIAKAKQWQAEYMLLRSILQETALEESFKWYQPCYLINGRNVVIMSGFTDRVVLGFFKGALLSDPHILLQQPGPNTQSSRFMAFTSVAQIEEQRAIIRDYLEEAIRNERAGLQVAFKKVSERLLPDELRRILDEREDVRQAFEKLTPGRQRLYIMHVESAKQVKTRLSRLDDCIPKILAGKGLRDEYQHKKR
jgi:uncharacterized protein YdeI (YjbR/CyaY-like superfamily)